MQTTLTLACDGRSRTFNAPFPAAAPPDVLVYLVAEGAGAARPLTLNTDFELQLLASSLVVTTHQVYPAGLSVRIERRTAVPDLSDARRIGFAVQELLNDQRALVCVPGEAMQALPSRARRARRLLAFDDHGDPIAVVGVDPSSATHLQLMLADTVFDNTGAGMVAYDPRLDYPAGTVGAQLQELARRIDALGG